jgi:protease I
MQQTNGNTRDRESPRFDLEGKTVAVLATSGVEQEEILKPLAALRDAGATAHVVSLPGDGDTIRGWRHGEWGEEIPVDRRVDDVSADGYDALVLPGGQMNPDRLRLDDAAVGFVRDFFREHKPVAAICHGPWMLAEAGVLEGRRVTSWPSIRTDLENAGAVWTDEEVVVDSGLVTSRKPDDLAAFNRKLVEEIHEGAHAGQTA